MAEKSADVPAASKAPPPQEMQAETATPEPPVGEEVPQGAAGDKTKAQHPPPAAPPADTSARDGEVSKQDDLRYQKPKLMIIGCGPAGLAVARAVAQEFTVTIVEPKDYYEYTPGILRGFANPDHMKYLEVSLQRVFKDFTVGHIRGEVVNLMEHSAEVRLCDKPEAEDRVVIDFDYAVVAVGSQYAGSGLWKVTGAPGEASLTTLAGRQEAYATHYQELLSLKETGGTVVLVGAGLVGVELAAELAYYLPGLKIVLADLADKVLPPLPPGAQEYAKKWLEKHGVELRLGNALERGKEAESLGITGPSIVYGCAGVRMRNSFMETLDCLDERGAIRVNHAMQVLTNKVNGDDLAKLGPERAHICGGHLFALGDCISLQGASAPLGREVYPAEAAAEVVVKNLRLAKSGLDLKSCPAKSLCELKEPLNQMTICSLGPKDAVFVGNGSVWMTGRKAAFAKDQIESSKMSQYRNELWGNLIWGLVPHW
mmetsp:Transcript_28289/g.65623  ORF Transcript_28289/g.65623 Transcript_28289/m.65623 type:complete len:485 (-) Transcript_28289:128-1582(-)|eukprot:CAMPEP_0178380908 /NCGR_PEP_ID=MMETSP0689_2-20121128/5708_1 /TAXON_ID=160604 /ORGANISM="Amphidinium massartii, Strain CS-259" /LENGTH=484 /DNA_ID=CAMNT_0020001071 /DNA_START=24 /DNA_END=1478 /DNA_ORIENTATION=-